MYNKSRFPVWCVGLCLILVKLDAQIARPIVTMDYAIRSDNKMTMFCKIDANQKNISDFSNVLLRCPQVNTKVCSINCQQTCIQRDNKCYISDELHQTLEDCIMKKDLESGQITIEYLINLSQITQSGKWSCEYRGVKSKAHFLKMVEKKDMPQQDSQQDVETINLSRELEERRDDTLDKTREKFTLDALSGPEEAQPPRQTGNKDFYSWFDQLFTKFKELTRKKDVFLGLFIVFALSLVLNTILLIRCYLAKAYFDSLRRGHVSRFLSNCLCFRYDKKSESYLIESQEKSRKQLSGFIPAQMMNYSEGIDSGIYAGHFIQTTGSQNGSLIYQPMPGNLGYPGRMADQTFAPIVPNQGSSLNNFHSDDNQSTNNPNSSSTRGKFTSASPSSIQDQVSLMEADPRGLNENMSQQFHGHQLVIRTPMVSQSNPGASNSNQNRISSEYNELIHTQQSHNTGRNHEKAPHQMFTLVSSNGNDSVNSHKLISRPVLIEGFTLSHCSNAPPKASMAGDSNSIDSYIVTNCGKKPVHNFPHTTPQLQLRNLKAP